MMNPRKVQRFEFTFTKADYDSACDCFDSISTVLCPDVDTVSVNSSSFEWLQLWLARELAFMEAVMDSEDIENVV